MSSELTVEVFPASDGDSLLVAVDKNYILIDAGRLETYETFIKNRLEAIKKESSMLDLLIVTHIDEDHIEGAIRLLQDNGGSERSEVVQICEVWHNSYRHLQFPKQGMIMETENEILNGIIASGNKPLIQKDGPKEISSKQGSTLAALILAGKYKWNHSFHGQSVNTDNVNTLSYPKFGIKLLSPSTSKLKRLEKKWKRDLLKLKSDFVFSDDKKFDDAFEFYMRMGLDENNDETNKPISDSKYTFEDLLQVECKIDPSVTNGSSIAFILEAKGKRLLFLGDAHPDIIYSELEKMKNEKSKVAFDLVKISHHGSCRNTNKQLLDLIDCSKFVISTNGESHNHPDLSTLALLVQLASEKEITLYCNYKTENSQIIERLSSAKKLKCNFVYAEDNRTLKIDV